MMTARPSLRRTLLTAALLLASLVFLAAAPQRADAQEGEPPTRLGLPVDELVRLYVKKYAWSSADSGVTQPDLTAAAISPVDARLLLVGGNGQVFRSRDDGLSWDNPLSVQGLDQSVDRGGAGGPRFDFASRRQELIDQRVQERFQEEREAFVRDLEDDGTDTDFAEELAEEVEDDLLDQARDLVLTEDLAAIEAQVRDEANRTPGADAAGQDPAAGGDLLLANAIRRLEAHPALPAVSFAATGAGLYRSDNFGSSWSLIFNGLGGDSRFTTSVTVLGGRVYVGTEEGMYVSADGIAWDRFPGRQGNLPIFDLASAPSGALGALTREGLFISTDSGATFTRTTLPVELDDADLTSLAFDPNDPRRVAIGTSRGVYVSDDGGLTLTRATVVGLPSLIVQDVLWHPAAGGVLLAATDRGVFINPDGAEWGELYEGLGNNDVRQIAVAHQAPWTLLASTAAGPYIYGPQGRLEARREAIRKLQETWEREPSLGATLGAAMRFNFLEQDRMESLESRSRWASLLPRIRGRGDITRLRNEQDRLLVTEPDLAISRTRTLLRQPEGTSWQIVAMWDLNEVLFSPQELPAQRTVQSLQAQRRKLLTQLVRVYHRRRTLQQRQALRAEGDSPQQVKEALDIDLLTAQLDALTDSFFTRYTTLRSKP